MLTKIHHDYGYCVKCRKWTKTRDARYVTTARGGRKEMQKGKCSKCGLNKTKFIKRKVDDFTSSPTARTVRIKLPWLPGELHLPGHSFTGPGTRFDMRLNSDSTPKSWSTHQSHRQCGVPTWFGVFEIFGRREKKCHRPKNDQRIGRYRKTYAERASGAINSKTNF